MARFWDKFLGRKKKPEQYPKLNTKVILIGLDAATLRFIEPLMKDGKLPNLKKMCDGGSCGILTSIRPAISPIVWTTIFTGKRRKKHNILGFYSNKSELNARRIWEILHHNGQKVGTLGAFLTSPPEEHYSFQIPNIWVKKDNKTYPSEYQFLQHWFELKPRAFNRLTEFGISDNTIRFLKKFKRKFPHMGRKATSPQIHFGNLYLRTEAFIHLLRKNNPDFGLIAFYGADAFQHIFMHHYKPKWFDLTQDEVNPNLAKLIPRYYSEFDKQLGKIMNAHGNDTNYIIVSDHGARPSPKELRTTFRISETKLTQILKLTKVAKPTFAHGYITLELPEDIIESTAKTLSEIKLEENDLNLISVIRKFEKKLEIQQNPDVMRSTDMHNMHLNINGRKITLKDILISNNRWGMHHIHGFYSCFGPAFKKPKEQKEISILDIVPIILTIFNLPVGNDMDGKVPVELMKDELTKVIVSEKPYEELIPPETEIADIDSEKIKKQLEGMGYIG